MASYQKRLLFLLFFLSGFCGLLYQVVWVRMSFASFGVITPVLSVVISVFMLGLFVGSWLAGKLAVPVTRQFGVSAIWLYAIAEVVIGVGAFAVPYLFALGETALLPVGGTDSAAYLLWSALIIAGAIFPWCVFMGATFPLMMAYVKEQASGETTSFSFLYLANVIGAMCGTLVTAVVLVELLGFRDTLLVAAAANLFIAVTAATLGLRSPHSPITPVEAPAAPKRFAALPSGAGAKLAALILFTTGFTSMAMEVVWTRAFTVVLQTQVYSFAMLLFVYLLATWIGSLRYRHDLAKSEIVSTERLIAWLALTSLLPIVVNDPRLQLRGVGALLSIFPFCALLGYLTPKLIDEYSSGDPDRAGFSYALNILGCILGPLVASYWMLPTLGLKGSLLVLAAPYLVLFVIAGGRTLAAHRRVAYWTAALLLLALVVNRTYEDQVQGYRRGKNGVVRRDHTATVISYGEGMDKRLLVNGIGITHLTPITKVMAHLPLALVEHKPTSALVICFGMGTTFRSLMSWGLDATAVELVPSVKDAFPYYFDDAAELMTRPNGKIVIDDGRRFLRRTGETFDVVTLDPPPPVEAAGSSLLYSEEFYASVKDRLRPGGILQQWIPQAEDRIVQAVVRSLTNSFPYVKMYRSFEGWGHHFLASMSPIRVPSPEEIARRMPAAAKADLLEWNDPGNPKLATTESFFELIVQQEKDARTFLRGRETVTDDRPYNEYYLIRRTLHPTQKAG